MSPHRHRQPRGGRGATTREREPEVAHNGLRVAVLERRGRFLLGEPFFERGRGVPVERDHRAAQLALTHDTVLSG